MVIPQVEIHNPALKGGEWVASHLVHFMAGLTSYHGLVASLGVVPLDNLEQSSMRQGTGIAHDDSQPLVPWLSNITIFLLHTSDPLAKMRCTSVTLAFKLLSV